MLSPLSWCTNYFIGWNNSPRHSHHFSSHLFVLHLPVNTNMSPGKYIYSMYYNSNYSSQLIYKVGRVALNNKWISSISSLFDNAVFNIIFLTTFVITFLLYKRVTLRNSCGMQFLLYVLPKLTYALKQLAVC